MSENENQLIEAAKAARLRSVAHFSNFLVGAALRTDAGKVFTGCNIESASYGLTVCAERVAIWKALSEGERDFTRLVIVDHTPVRRDATTSRRSRRRNVAPGVSPGYQAQLLKRAPKGRQTFAGLVLILNEAT